MSASITAAVVKDFPLDQLNNFHLPCQVSHYMLAETQQDIIDGLDYVNQRSLAVTPIGDGTNIILPPKWPVCCLHIKTRGVTVLDEQQDHTLLKVSAGENWHGLVTDSLARGYFGLENLALIPGTVGAAPIQNIGAYGKEVKDFIHSLDTIKISNGDKQSFSAAECEFTYRSSKFKTTWQNQFIITHVVFRLNKTADINIQYDSLSSALEQADITNPQPQDIYQAVCKLRQSKLPSNVGNVGSFFHNPILCTSQFVALQQAFPQIKGVPLAEDRVRVAAASLIEAAGWKGHQEQRVAVYDKHSLCLINKGDAKQQDVIQLANKIIEDIKVRFKVTLTIEPHIY